MKYGSVVFVHSKWLTVNSNIGIKVNSFLDYFTYYLYMFENPDWYIVWKQTWNFIITFINLDLPALEGIERHRKEFKKILLRKLIEHAWLYVDLSWYSNYSMTSSSRIWRERSHFLCPLAKSQVLNVDNVIRCESRDSP